MSNGRSPMKLGQKASNIVFYFGMFYGLISFKYNENKTNGVFAITKKCQKLKKKGFRQKVAL